MEHGTPSAYRRHLRNDEPACEDCLAANARAIREWRHKTGANTARLVPDATLRRHGLEGELR